MARTLTRLELRTKRDQGKDTQRLLPTRRGEAAQKAALTRCDRGGDDDGGDAIQQRTPDLQTPSKAALLQTVFSYDES
jgi:hypothetical protein